MDAPFSRNRGLKEAKKGAPKKGAPRRSACFPLYSMWSPHFRQSYSWYQYIMLRPSLSRLRRQDVDGAPFHPQLVLTKQGYSLGKNDPFCLLHHPALEHFGGVSLLHGHRLLQTQWARRRTPR